MPGVPQSTNKPLGTTPQRFTPAMPGAPLQTSLLYTPAMPGVQLVDHNSMYFPARPGVLWQLELRLGQVHFSLKTVTFVDLFPGHRTFIWDTSSDLDPYLWRSLEGIQIPSLNITSLVVYIYTILVLLPLLRITFFKISSRFSFVSLLLPLLYT